MLSIIILAAGKGTRMKSELPKVLFEVAGKPMISYVLELAETLNPERTILVIGSGAETVRKRLEGEKITFCLQKEQKGTADAVIEAMKLIPKDEPGKVLILCGDMPLMKNETLKTFMDKSDKPINFISVNAPDPKGYGRVVKAAGGEVIKIVEEKDANPYEQKITEINAGVYYCDVHELRKRLSKVTNNNAQNEFYLTDIVKGGANAYQHDDYKEFTGVNDRLQLAEAASILWQQRAAEIMKAGVTIMDAKTFYCDGDVKIGQDTVIYPNVVIEKGSAIGKNCQIYPGCRIEASFIEEGCRILDGTLIENSFIGAASVIGPMAHLRPGSKLEGDNRVGNFVELKKTGLGKGSKASHLSYLGDAKIGANVNIGCGTITCNYDGFNKYETVIGDEVFVGSDVQFVAPVEIEQGALIASGTTVTRNVPKNALAIARVQQDNQAEKGKIIMERNRAKKR